jgi:hypothetical protein
MMPGRLLDPLTLACPRSGQRGAEVGLRPILAAHRRCQGLAANCSRRPRSAVSGWYPAAQMLAAYRSTSM